MNRDDQTVGDGESAASGSPARQTSGPTFVLVGPQSAGNVGSVARALTNLGFTRLTIVHPECDPLDPAARRMAVHGIDVLASARIVDDLDVALASATAVLGTSAQRGKQRVPHWRLDRMRGELERLPLDGLHVMFGREDSGLTDEELDRCTHLVGLAVHPGYTSFNLAQAVLLVGYELFLANGARDLASDPHAGLPFAAQAEREAMYTHWGRALEAIGFVQPSTATSIGRRFRRLFGRARLRRDEVVMLRGLARQTLWAAGQAGLADAADEPSDGDAES